ncbi:MAG TPA: aminodeoxychorismate/anthranilate synthase component II [Candidatus Limnocylindria bacterium]|nr:aminodeoxychorismate/anthranilate synthase component II [Candidatus Limnocylindria bacterium]
MRILLVDNLDSFTHNIAQALAALGADVDVRRIDDPTLDDALRAGPDGVVVSPGPGRPEDADVALRVVREAPERGIPTLGVCLGLQCAVVAFGGRVIRAPEPRHGKTSTVTHDGLGVFAGIHGPTVATRYHSLVAEEGSLPADLVVTARSEDGQVMGIRHRGLPLEAVQFHPESVLSADGPRMLANYCEAVRRGSRTVPA